MRDDLIAWIRLLLFLLLIMLFSIWAIEAERAYNQEQQMQQETTAPEQKAPIYVTPLSTTASTTAPETAPEPTSETPTEVTTPETETAPAVTEQPTEPETEPTQIRYELTDYERMVVEAVVAAEARGEDFDGQALVAQCILNTAEALGKRPSQVVLAEGQYAAPQYEHREEVSDAVSAVFDHGYEVTTEPIRFFYAQKRCYSSWHENYLVFVLEHGGHRFFRFP